MSSPSLSATIFLSIFRGGTYIEDQLRSLENQERVELTLVYHMDEEDAHVENLILDSRLHTKRIQSEEGQGVPKAYFTLVKATPMQSDLYAFCDQDDVWSSKKLVRAGKALSRCTDTPALWVSRVRTIGDVQRRLTCEEIFPRHIPSPSFGNALVEGVGPGCAMVWNQALQEKLVSAPQPTGAMMHDAWLYLLATAFGHVIVDPEPLVDYRIHSENTVGIRRSLRSRLLRLWVLMSQKERPTLESQAQCFDNLYGVNLDKEKKSLVDAIAKGDRSIRVKLWSKRLIRRQNSFDNFLLLVRLLLVPSRRL